MSELYEAAEQGDLERVKYLVEQGVNIHANNDDALKEASQKGHLEVVKYLVEHGADIHANNDAPLRWASRNGRLEDVKYLVEHGANWRILPKETIAIVERDTREKLKGQLRTSYLSILRTSPVRLDRNIIKSISYRSVYEELCSQIKGNIPPLNYWR